MKFPNFLTLFIFGLTLFGIQVIQVRGQTLWNLLNHSGKILQGIAISTTNTVKTLFENTKQTVFGLPFEIAADKFNFACSATVGFTSIVSNPKPDINGMQFQLRVACEKFSFPLQNANEMLKTPGFDPTKKVVILATGWTQTVNRSQTIDILFSAYHCRKDVNFVVIDSNKYLKTLYTWAAYNTDEIGKYVAIGLAKLSTIVPTENIQLIGHSMGAHIAGTAGRHFALLTGKNIPRITGLDPAKPCFNEGEHLSGLSRGDADFVDVIHSNSGVIGKRNPVGDVDFYPGGSGSLSPGCIDIICAHFRAVEYFAESIYPGNEKNFMSKRCNSLESLHQGKCPGPEFPMGYATPTNLRGKYFLDVNKKSPFGRKGTNQQLKRMKLCGFCNKRR